MNKLLIRLPQKYYNRVKNLEAESGLIDNCKYIVHRIKTNQKLFAQNA